MSAGAGEHTPEPWLIHGAMLGYRGDIFSPTAKKVTDCHHIARCFAPKPDKDVICELQALQIERDAIAVIEANAARIVACVNACAGIPTDQLSTLMGEVRGVLAQYRDDLRRPPAADSTERRLAAVTALLAKLPVQP